MTTDQRSAPSEHKRRVALWKRIPWKRIRWLLVALAASFGLSVYLALAFYPNRSFPVGSFPMTVTLNSETAPIRSLSMNILPSANFTLIVVRLEFVAPPDAVERAQLTLNGGTINYSSEDRGGGASLTLRGSHLLFVGNGVNIYGALPILFPEGLGISPVQPPPQIFISYEYPDAFLYQWSGAIAATASVDSVAWSSSQYPTGQPVQITAVNPSAQSSDTGQTFVAGAFVGVAGGALIGFVTELVTEIVKKLNRPAKGASGG